MRFTIGIDIGGTKMRSALVSEHGAIETVREIATPVDPGAVIAAAGAAIAALGIERAEAIGIGVPGRVNAATGEVLSGGFVDLSGVALRQTIAREAGKPVTIGNDAGMALVGEARVGAAKGAAHAVLLTIGTGIGGAVMADGRILNGRGAAGQLGHIRVDVNGLACLCGGRGCLETAGSGTALNRLLSAAGLPALDAAELLKREDAAAKSVVKAWALPLRAGIDSLVAALDPELLILGGGLGAAAARALADFPAASAWYRCEVKAAALGPDAGVIGAALAALEA